MQLLKLTLRLPRCLTATDDDGDLPCTLVRIAAATLTKTAAHMLASAIEEEAAAAAAQQHGTDDDESGEEEGNGKKDRVGRSGVFVLPLAPAHEHEAISQLFVFGQLPDPETIPAAAKRCGLELALTDEGAISAFNEGHLHEIGLILLRHHMAKHGFLKLFDHVYIKAAQLFDRQAAPAAPRFLEGVKLLPLLDARTTNPFAAGPEGGDGGVLGLSISFEPQVYKWVPVDWAAIRAYAEHRRQEREAQRRLVRKGREDDDDGEEGQHHGGFYGSQEEDGLHPFPEESEAALELLAVRALPGLTGHGFVSSLPMPTPEPTGLLRANQRHGFDLHIPSTEEAMWRFWRHSYQIELPAGPLEFCRVRFKGQDYSRAFTYPCACLAHEIALSYSRTTQAYTRLSRAALDLLGAMPGVLTAIYHSSTTTTTTAAAPAPSATVARPAAPTSAAMLALTPLKVGRAHAHADAPPASRLLLTSARQLRDQAQAQGIEEGELPGGVPLLLLPPSTAPRTATEEKEERADDAKTDDGGEGGKEDVVQPPPPRPAPTITTGRGAPPAAAAVAAAAAAKPRGKQPRVLSLFEDDDGGGEEEEDHGGEGPAFPPPAPAAEKPKPVLPSAKELMPPPAPSKPKPKPKPKVKAATAAAAAAGAGTKKRKEAPGGAVAKGAGKGGKKKAKGTTD